MTTSPAREYVQARAVLLDALDALGPHRHSTILVGAQAVYLHSGDSDFAVAPMTTDSDLALRVNTLESEPEIAAALTAAGFTSGRQPGSWLGRGDIAVDLMVVPHQSGRSSPSARAASIPPHTRKVARIAPGLEPALLDYAALDITALEPADPRTHTIAVAGPAALIAAKLLKISERLTAAQCWGDEQFRGCR